MITYILHVTVITTVCFLFYKLMLQKETFYRLNRWTLMTCLAVSFGLPLLPVPQSWSWRTKLDELAVAGRRWGREHKGAQAAKAAPVVATPTSMQEEFLSDSPVIVQRVIKGRKHSSRAKLAADSG